MSSSVVPELINAASEYFAAAPIILLSDHEDQESISRAFALGVKGFVPSSLASLTVVAVVRLICVGGSFAPASALVRPAPAPATVSHGDVIRHVTNGPDIHFTQRQTEILCCLHRGLSNKLIAHQLSMSENTVKVHVRAIMKRLHATNRTQAVCLTRSLPGPVADVVGIRGGVAPST
jgi:DNA-binding NarL/FixJ family response regulator